MFTFGWLGFFFGMCIGFFFGMSCMFSLATWRTGFPPRIAHHTADQCHDDQENE